MFRRTISRLIFVVLLFSSFINNAQPEPQKPARIMFLLDASSSMTNSWDAVNSRFQTAARIINSIVDSVHRVNKDVAFAVRVFGNQFPAQDKNCFDTKLEVPFSLGNDEQIKARLKYITPRGYSPIALSLKQTAENDFIESDEFGYSIILVTDGGESCGGDICATVANLLNKKISFKPYILSLVDYAPLRTEYACLGKYLQVANEKDIAPAISTIINDNRKALTIKASGIRQIQVKPTVTATPVIVKPQTPVVTIKADTVTHHDITPVVTKTVTPVVTVKKEEPAKVIVPPVAEVKRRPNIDRIFNVTRLRRMNMLYAINDGEPITVPHLGPIVIKLGDEPKAIIPDVVTKTPANNQPSLNKVDNTPSKPAPVKGTIVEPEPLKPVTVTNKPKKSTLKPPVKKGEEVLDFVEKAEDAKESTLQVYFTNGKGKFYNTEPQMTITNLATKTPTSLFRNVVGGEPTPIKLAPGTYDIIIPGSTSKVKNVVIEAGKNKKIYIKTSTGSLAFYYPSNPDRPVVEYRALVSKRFEQGPVVKQNCDTILPYDPTNYHVELNTLPPKTYNIDLDFNSTKVISIEEAGSIQISNRDNLGKVQFWYQLGDSFVPFYEMQVSGNPSLQRADFLPGIYQVRYFKGKVTALSKADVVLFRIKSKQFTTIELQ